MLQKKKERLENWSRKKNWVGMKWKGEKRKTVLHRKQLKKINKYKKGKLYFDSDEKKIKIEIGKNEVRIK